MLPFLPLSLLGEQSKEKSSGQPAGGSSCFYSAEEATRKVSPFIPNSSFLVVDGQAGSVYTSQFSSYTDGLSM